MSADVKWEPNGDVLLSRKFPPAQPGCPTVRLRWTAEEFAEFCSRVKAGEFDRDEDARWKLERLLEDVFSQGYDQGWSRGLRFGDDLARSRQKRDEKVAAEIDATEETR